MLIKSCSSSLRVAAPLHEPLNGVYVVPRWCVGSKPKLSPACGRQGTFHGGKLPKTPCAGSHVCLTAVHVQYPAPRCRPTLPHLGHRTRGARQRLETRRDGKKGDRTVRTRV